MTRVLCFIFFLSGASALLFETLWFRLAGLSFGNSVWASSVVLAAFMGGLGLGNLWAARNATRLKRPLIAYAWVEILIAVFGFGIVALLPVLTPVVASALRPLLGTPWMLHGARLVLAFVLLLVPATAMGVTLPLLVKTLSATDTNFGRVLGRLYGFNTLGAVIGALAGELWLIEELGLRGSGMAAASLNALAAISSLAVARKSRGADAPELSAADPVRARRGGKWLASAAVAGALLLGLEVVWFRFLQLFVAGSSLVFAVMLAVVLLGIACGGLLASVWLGARPSHYRLASFVALGASVATAFTYILFDDGFGWYGAFPIKPVPEPWPVFGMTAALCGPVSVLSGVLFTFFGRALRDDLGDETRATALLTLANTVGAMAGSVLAGFVLLPVLGIEGAVVSLGAAYFAVAWMSRPAPAPEEDPRETLFFMAGASGLAVLLYVFFPFGLMRNHYVPMTTLPHMQDGSELVALREGRTETAIYLRADLFGHPRQFRLITNGYAMSASTLRSERYMSLFAYWPAAVHPRPASALLISYGVGITAKALTEIDSLERIDVVDISADILELSRDVGMFEDTHPLDDPRVRVYIEDGRFFLQTTPETYDIITAEPPPPKNAGIVNLYTKEYFQFLYDRLAPGGYATYWLPVYQMALQESKAIAAAFCDAFTDCSLWTGAGTEWMLVGGREAISPHDDKLARTWEASGVGTGLDRIGVEGPGHLGALFLGDAAFLAEWTAGVPPLEDNFPARISSRWQYRAADYDPAMAEYFRVMEPSEALARFESSAWVEEFWPSRARATAVTDAPFQGLLTRHFEGQPATVPELSRVLSETERRTLPLILLDADDRDVRLAERGLAEGVVSPVAHYFVAAEAFAERRYSDAAKALASAIALDPDAIELEQYRVLALDLAGEAAAAAAAVDALRARTGGVGGLPGFWDWLESR